MAAAITLAQEIKRIKPDVHIFFGGVGTHGVSNIILEKFAAVDYIVAGEGELTVSDLIRSIESRDFTDLKGVYYRENGIVKYNGNHALIRELDKIPLPDFSLLSEINDYFLLFDNNRKSLNIEFARGCSGGCSFCGCFSFWCGQHRYFSIKKVINQIIALKRKYGINHVYLSDDNFMSNPDKVIEICNAMITNNVNVSWDTRGRVNDLKPQLLEIMQRAGCSEILVGIETADDNVLKNMNKRIKADDQYNAVLNVINAGILPILSLILGYEGETEGSINSSLSLLLKLLRTEKSMVFYFHILSLVPGTRLYQEKRKELCVHEIDSALEGLYYGKEKAPQREMELIKQYPEIFSIFYHVKSTVEYNFLVAIQRLTPILFPIFCYTFSFLEKKEKSILELLREFNEKYEIRQENDEIVENFSVFFYNKYSNDYILKNIFLHEALVYRLTKSSDDQEIFMNYDYNVVKQKQIFQQEGSLNPICKKTIYRYKKSGQRVNIFCEEQ